MADKVKNHNKRGFHTNNHTQDMRKDQFSPKNSLSGKKFGNERQITQTTEEAPSGEQSLPDLH